MSKGSEVFNKHYLECKMTDSEREYIDYLEERSKVLGELEEIKLEYDKGVEEVRKGNSLFDIERLNYDIGYKTFEVLSKYGEDVSVN